MKYIVLLLTLIVVAFGVKGSTHAQDLNQISALSGINADVDITFPSMDNVLADRALANFIARHVRTFKNEVRRAAIATGSVWSLSIDCKMVNATGSIHSVLCDVQGYVIGAKGVYDLRTFTVRGQTGAVLMLWDLLSANRILRMKRNIYNHLLYTLQATDDVSQKRIKDAVSSIDAHYNLFTMHFERKPSIILYITIPWFDRPQRVRVSYPEGKIMK